MNENNGDRPINDGGQPEVTSRIAETQDAGTQDAETTALPHSAEGAMQPAVNAATEPVVSEPVVPEPVVPQTHEAVPSPPAHHADPTAPAQAQYPAAPAQAQYPAAPAQAPQSARTEAYTSPASATQPAAGPAHAAPAMNPTEAIPAPYSSTPNPTERIPGHYSQQPQQAAPSHDQGQQTGTGHAGPGYPASNAYPHTLAPAVTARPRERKKVGMGMFTGGVLAAALIGGLVGGGSLYLLDQQGSAPVTASNQQSAPLVINNPNSVNEVSAAAAKAMPSVVTISATSGSSGGTGSGIILDKEGHILTNTHVVTLDGADAHASIEVQTSDGKVYAGTIVGTDPLSDLAVVKIEAPNLVPAELGESGKINVGDTVIAIGSPLGLNGTVTDGIVSTLNRTIQVASSAVPETPSDSSQDPSDGGNGFRFSPPGGGQDTTAAQGTVNLNVIQTDAAINPGNSGGALVNTDGKIIGVNVAIASTGSSSGSSQSGNIGVGFSIPIDHAKRVAQDIIATGKATHGQLGVSVKGTSATGSDSAFSAGATVAEVTSDTAAAKAGLKEGDVITKLGERTISDPSDLTAAVREQPGGATVKLDFTRGGKAQSVDVTLDTMPAG